MILLDTSAVLLVLRAHRRADPIHPYAGQLYVSPLTILELQILDEVARVKFTVRNPARAVRDDPRWEVDEPPLAAVAERALDLGWTRDPFDRLLAAHALWRGWRLATSDRAILENLPASSTIEL